MAATAKPEDSVEAVVDGVDTPPASTTTFNQQHTGGMVSEASASASKARGRQRITTPKQRLARLFYAAGGASPTPSPPAAAVGASMQSAAAGAVGGGRSSTADAGKGSRTCKPPLLSGAALAHAHAHADAHAPAAHGRRWSAPVEPPAAAPAGAAPCSNAAACTPTSAAPCRTPPSALQSRRQQREAVARRNAAAVEKHVNRRRRNSLPGVMERLAASASKSVLPHGRETPEEEAWRTGGDGGKVNQQGASTCHPGVIVDVGDDAIQCGVKAGLRGVDGGAEEAVAWQLPLESPGSCSLLTTARFAEAGWGEQQGGEEEGQGYSLERATSTQEEVRH